MASGLSSVSGQVPQTTDSEAEICGPSPHPREREGRVLSQQSKELSGKAGAAKASPTTQGSLRLGKPFRAHSERPVIDSLDRM